MPELERLRRALAAADGDSDSGHLPEALWERLACDELGRREREHALRHILACPTCSRTHRALLTLRREAGAFDASAPAPVRTPSSGTGPRRWVPWRGLGILAAAATVVLAVVLPLRHDREPMMQPAVDVLRGSAEEAAATPIEPIGDVDWQPGDDVALAWTEGGEAHPAEVEILDAEGELAWTSPRTTAAQTMWPGELIPGPGTYYWRVVVHDPSAGDSSSELVSFALITASLP